MNRNGRPVRRRPMTSPALDAFFAQRDEVVERAARPRRRRELRSGPRALRERVDRELVRKLEEDRFHLVVVGEFNHGKTTFVNALLGAARAARRRHADDRGHPPHPLGRASRGHRRRRRTARARPIPFEEAKRFAVGGGAVDGTDVDYLEIGYPAPLLQERILLVDTPGVNDLSLQRADITYSYIPRADAVLFLLDAGQILKESERVFLNDKLLKASRDKIVFVITKWDLLSPGRAARGARLREEPARRRW